MGGTLLLCSAAWGLCSFNPPPVSFCLCGVITVDGAAGIGSAGGDMIGQNYIQQLSSTDLPLTAASPVDLLNDPVSKRSVVLDNSSMNSRKTARACVGPCQPTVAK